ncbi:MAG TPA: DNA repair protein RecN [Burkholderiales bacterium]|nr:DNA repair protein RecN [Burkholderiales bacterium]
MLRSLTIQDFVIVDRLELEFEPGFTVLTGETGAGKSILIDALALALGGRAEALVVRSGAARAEVSAEFDAGARTRIAEWLARNDLAGEEGTCLLRRVIEASGRSRGFVNGRPATAAQLREAGELLVGIHGQHQHQLLLDASEQRGLLDAYGGHAPLAAEVAALHRAWRARRETRIAFESNAAALAAERERLEWEVRELDALGLAPGEWAELTAEHTRLAHAASLIEAAQQGLEALSEGEGAALARLDAVIGRLASLGGFDPRLAQILELLEPARIQLQEAVYGLRRYGERLELDPARLHEVEARIEAVHAAARKYRVSPEELPERLAASRARLAELAGGGDVETLKRLEQEAHAACVAGANRLSAARRKAAKKLSDQVTAMMQELAMEGGRFEVALSAEPEVSASGLERVEFRVSVHKGAAPLPLAKVASGGELSRLSLAIQTAAGEAAQVPTLIFDEVDAGIGGRVAQIVGRMLKQLGTRRQVMCITHLPQVAACADHQWRVAKITANGGIASRVTVLDREQRVEEIARMLGGARITETTRRHAAEMLGIKT